MDKEIDPVYYTLENEKDSVTQKGGHKKLTNNNVKLEIQNQEGLHSLKVVCESHLAEETFANEAPEYAVVNKSNTTEVLSVNFQNEGKVRASTPPYDVLNETKGSHKRIHKLPSDNKNSNFAVASKGDVQGKNAINKCKYYGKLLAYGAVAVIFMITFIFILLVYKEILALKEKQETAIGSNTFNSNNDMDSTLYLHLVKILNISSTTRPISVDVNVSSIESVIKTYLDNIIQNNSCTLKCSNGIATQCSSVHSNISNGKWMKIADIDTRVNITCPSPNFKLTTVSGFNTCKSLDPAAGCYSAFFNTSGMAYTKVYGRVRAYQYRRTNSFQEYAGGQRGNSTIDEPYVDGVSLTYGNPRQHIWTFASDLNQSSSFCPCGTSRNITIPDFVGDDYFCDSGIQRNENYTAAFSNPLWDGLGCCPDYGCCSHNCPPWFYKELDECTSDPIEFRVCRDQINSNEDILIEAIDIFIN